MHCVGAGCGTLPYFTCGKEVCTLWAFTAGSVSLLLYNMEWNTYAVHYETLRVKDVWKYLSIQLADFNYLLKTIFVTLFVAYITV